MIDDQLMADALQVTGLKTKKEADFLEAKKLLLSLPVHPVLDTNIALKSADNFRLLQKKGITVRKTINVIIATYCI